MPDTLPTPDSVPVVSPDGAPYHVPAAEADQFYRQGYKPSSEDQNAHLKALSEAGEHPIEAGLEGAARGAIPFAPSLLEAAGDTKEGQELRRQANPVASKVGEVAGNVAQFAGLEAATGGLGGLAEAGATGGKILNAADMARQAAIMAGQGASNEINEESIGDKEYNSEAILSQAGLGAVLGAASSPAFALAKEVLPNPLQLAGKAVAKASDAAADLVGRLSGSPEAAAEIYARGDAKAAANDSAQKLADALNETREKVGDQADAAFGDLRKGAIESAAKDDAGAGHTIEKTQQGATAFRDAATQTLDKMELDSQAAFKRSGAPTVDGTVLKKAREAVETYADDIADATTVPEFHDAAYRLRKAIDPLQKYQRDLSGTARETASAVEKGIQTPLRQMLKDPEVFGAKVAETHSQLMDAWKDLVQADGAMVSKLGGRDLLESGRPSAQKEIKASKALSFLKGEEGLSQQDARRYVDSYLQSAGKFNEMAAKLAREGNRTMDTSEIENLISSARGARESGASTVALAHGAPGGLGPEMLAAGLGHMSGIPGAGYAAAAATKLARAAKYPASTLEMLGKIKALADKHTAEIAKGASKFMDGASIAAPEAGLHAFKGGRDWYAAKEPSSEVEKRMAEVSNLASNPELFRKTVMQNTSGIMDGAPNHAGLLIMGAQKRLGILNAVNPPKQPPSMIKTKIPPSIDAQQRFEKAMKLSNHPTKTILGAMSDGSLTNGMIAAADQMAPKSMQALRSALQSEMVDRHDQDYTLAQKQALSMLFMQPVSPDMAPQHVAFLQGTFAQQQQVPQGQGPGGTRVQGLEKLTVAQNTATPGQSRQMNKEG